MRPTCPFTFRGRPQTKPGTPDDQKRIALSQWITRILVRDGDEAPGAYLTPGAAGYTDAEMADTDHHYAHLTKPEALPEPELKAMALNLLREGTRQTELEKLLDVSYATLVAWRKDEKFLAAWEAARETGKQFQTRSNVRRDAKNAVRVPESEPAAPAAPRPTADSPAAQKRRLPTHPPIDYEARKREVLALAAAGKTTPKIIAAVRGFHPIALAEFRKDPAFKKAWDELRAAQRAAVVRAPAPAPPESELPALVLDVPPRTASPSDQAHYVVQSGTFVSDRMPKEEATERAKQLVLKNKKTAYVLRVVMEVLPEVVTVARVKLC